MKTYIWGAGTWGKVAYLVLKSQFEIEGFIDKNPQKKGSKIEGLTVYTPDILLSDTNSEKPNVIVAIDLYWKDVFNELNQKYNIPQALLFKEEHTCVLLPTSLNRENTCINDEVIIRFTDDMGNQMFQYALGRKLVSLGSYVTGDFSLCIKPGEDKNLENIFKNVKILPCNKSKLLEYLNPEKKYGSVFLQYNENLDCGTRLIEHSVFSVKKGCINGYWTNPGYFSGIESEIRHTFDFTESVIQANDLELVKLADEIKSCESISFHVRGGDYLSDINSKIFGGICTYDYYAKAIDKIKELKGNIDLHIFIFTNDKNWYLKNFEGLFSEKEINYVKIIEGNMFTNYYDWYDMYLMTICKNNIIANSTFSWWGAWLNQTPERLVIAPKRFSNVYDEPGKCPPEWIRI